MLYQVKVAYLKDGANYVNERGEIYTVKTKVPMTPDCAQHYIDQATEQGLLLSYEEQTLQVTEEESLFYELGGYEVTPVPLTDPASINHRWQEFLNKMSVSEKRVLLRSLVITLGSDAQVFDLEDWKVAQQIYTLLSQEQSQRLAS